MIPSWEVGNPYSTQEQLLDVCLYHKGMAEAFADCKQVAVSWDASTYDCEVLVTVAHDQKSGITGFLPIQCMAPVMTEELDTEVQRLAFEGRATRVENFSTLRAAWPGESKYSTLFHFVHCLVVKDLSNDSPTRLSPMP